MNQIFRTAGYSYVEDVLDQMLTTMTLLGSCKIPQCQQWYAKVETAYRNLRKVKDSPPEDLQNNFYGSQLNKALIDATKILNDKMITEFLSKAQPGWSQNINETTGTKKLNWLQWESMGNVADKIIYIPSQSPSVPGQITLKGLNLGTSRAANSVRSTMGEWMQEQSTPIDKWQSQNDVIIRGTKEAWEKFVDAAKYILGNTSLLESKRFRPALPSESALNPSYQKPEEDKAPRFLEAYLLNYPEDPNSLNSWDVGPKKQEQKKQQGIRLQFALNDPMFYNIRNLVQEAGFSNIRTSFNDAFIDIFEPNATKWNAVWKKLQYWRYDIKKLNRLIEQFTGKSVGAVAKEKAKVQKAEGLKPGAIANAIQANLNINENNKLQASIAQRFGSGTTMSEDELNISLEHYYPNAFGENIPDSQKAAQKQGIFFAASRNVSVLADAPGSGKTMQAIVAADLVRENNQKVLVITPNILIRENWMGPQAKGPMFFAKHNPTRVARVNNVSDLQQAVENPEVSWIVVPFSAFRTKSANELAVAIGNYSDKNIFSSLIIDEIQTIRQQKSNTYSAIQRAISSNGVRSDGTPYGIKHRIGVSGTPADNEPSDVYTQLHLLRHPLLYGNKGVRTTGEIDWVLRLNQEGFSKQFLGGGMLKPITLTAEQRNLPPQEQELYVSRNTGFQVRSLLEWAKRLTTEQKLQILDLFSSTYLRRDKKDIRPDIPEKKVVENALPAPEGMDHSTRMHNWHQEKLMQMAFAKIPYTVGKALQYLQDPKQKIFIVTKHPEVAKQIVNEINAKTGEGTAAAVTGETGEDERGLVPTVFRQQAGILPGKQAPLKVVVYTMQLGAVGLNFANATKAIFNDLDWNPSDNLQAEYRVHRIDSQEPVQIDYMFFEGTYDEEMYRRVIRKQKVNDGVTEVMREAGFSSDPQQRLMLANQFIVYLVDSLLFELDLNDTQKQEIQAAKHQILSTAQPVNQTERAVAAKNWFQRSFVKN